MQYLKLVNQKNPLESTFIPLHLMEDKISKVRACQIALKAFRCLNHGLVRERLEPLVLVSGYRSFNYQKALFDKKKQFFVKQGLDEKEAWLHAKQIVAPPGCSEHQLGLAIDVTDFKMKDLDDPLITDFEETHQGRWLKQNSPKYGFILRYPQDKVAITGITYEPWHYRYVGVRHATKMQHKDLCLEEYLGYFKKEKGDIN